MLQKYSVPMFKKSDKTVAKRHEQLKKQMDKLMESEDSQEVRDAAVEREQFCVDLQKLSGDLSEIIADLSSKKRAFAEMIRQQKVHIKKLTNRFTPVIFK